MKAEEWTKHWESEYGNANWKVWVRMLAKSYKELLKDVRVKNPKILEMGSGSGINSLLLSDYLKCGDITLVDFNKKAMEISKKLSWNSGIKVKQIHADVLKLGTKEKFDIVHSEGLLEHFYGKERLAVLKKHIDCCRKGGYVAIFVPRKSVQYSLFRWGVTKLGRWIWDEEPLSVAEMRKMCEQLGQKIIKIYKPLFMYQAGFLIRKE